MSPSARGTFYTDHNPALWRALLPVFGHVVTYNYIGGGSKSGVEMIITEGVESETRSPGRYTRAMVMNKDLDQVPLQGDFLDIDGQIYDVVKVDVTLVDITKLVVQLHRD